MPADNFEATVNEFESALLNNPDYWDRKGRDLVAINFNKSRYKQALCYALSAYKMLSPRVIGRWDFKAEQALSEVCRNLASISTHYLWQLFSKRPFSLSDLLTAVKVCEIANQCHNEGYRSGSFDERILAKLNGTYFLTKVNILSWGLWLQRALQKVSSQTSDSPIVDDEIRQAEKLLNLILIDWENEIRENLRAIPNHEHPREEYNVGKTAFFDEKQEPIVITFVAFESSWGNRAILATIKGDYPQAKRCIKKARSYSKNIDAFNANQTTSSRAPFFGSFRLLRDDFQMP